MENNLPGKDNEKLDNISKNKILDNNASEKHNKKMLIMFGIFFVFVGILSIILIAQALGQTSSLNLNGCVAVYPITGEITTESIPSSLFDPGIKGSEEIAKEIEELGKDDNVKAIVFVINSPGGSVVATREIYEAAKKINKPKVAYYREIAASGGLYFSMASDEIVANPDSLTGSIGVKMQTINYEGLMKKLGIRDITIASGAMKDIGNPARNMTDEEYNVLKSIILESFDEFKSVVMESRGKRLNLTLFKKIIDGRVLTGRQAFKVGLVDKLGNKQDAIELAKKMAGNEDLEVCEQGKNGFSFGFENLADYLIRKMKNKVSLNYE